MGIIKSIFGNLNPIKLFSRWSELGVYKANFSSFGKDIYQSEIIRSCVRPLAEHSSKANVKCTDKRIERLLNVSPNPYMNGKDFLYKVRTQLEIKNTAFIYVQRDDTNKVIGYYPVPYSYFEAVEYNGGLYIDFHFASNETRELVIPWNDLAVLRKDYFNGDIAGDDNNAILSTLELIHTTNQGVANAIKATANLRGILKSTKGMLTPESLKAQKEAFVKDYLNISNEGGIASLDATQEFTPIKMEPTVANYAQMKEFRENVQRYYNMSDAIIRSDYTESQMEAFYGARIEPFLLALSLELTRRTFTDHAQGFGNYIIYEANRLQFATMSTKVTVFKEVVLYGGMTINEWRQGCNMAPLPGGDVPIRRLDAAAVNEEPKEDSEQEGENENE